MMIVLKRRIEYDVVEMPDDELVNIVQAAALLGISEGGVRSAMARGVLTEYVDEDKSWHGRRLVSRKELISYRDRQL